MQEHHLAVFYDGHCPFCVRSKNVLEKLDRLNLLSFVSFRELRNEEMPLDPVEMENAMVAVSGTKKYAGMHAVSKIFKQIPELFPLYLGISVLNLLGVGERVYSKIARSRYSFLIGRCTNECIT